MASCFDPVCVVWRMLCSSSLCVVFLNHLVPFSYNRRPCTALERARESSVVALRDKLYTQCIDMLYSYRRYCAQSTTPGQLILPEALKFLPVYVLALSKTPAFRTSALCYFALWASFFSPTHSRLSLCAVFYPFLFTQLPMCVWMSALHHRRSFSNCHLRTRRS